MIYKHHIEPGDIRQGSLGDCYFLCALASMTVSRYLIKRLILTKSYNKEGVYGVFFCDTGDWRLIILDD